MDAHGVGGADGGRGRGGCGRPRPGGGRSRLSGMRIVCADGEPQYRRRLAEDQLTRLEAAGHELVWFDGAPPAVEGWSERVRDAEGLLLLWRLPRGVLTANGTLQVVSFVGT